jgi:hypothetical protein
MKGRDVGVGTNRRSSWQAEGQPNNHRWQSLSERESAKTQEYPTKLPRRNIPHKIGQHRQPIPRRFFGVKLGGHNGSLAQGGADVLATVGDDRGIYPWIRRFHIVGMNEVHPGFPRQFLPEGAVGLG